MNAGMIFLTDMSRLCIHCISPSHQAKQRLMSDHNLTSGKVTVYALPERMLKEFERDSIGATASRAAELRERRNESVRYFALSRPM